MDLIKLILGMVVVYLLVAIYFGIMRKTKAFKKGKNFLKVIIVIIIIIVILMMVFPFLADWLFPYLKR